MQAADVLQRTSVMPVMVIDDLKTALPMARALIAGGIDVLEITLRTPAGLDAIKLLNDEFPHALVGAGTVTTPQQLEQVVAAGAKFAISPGITEPLLAAGQTSDIPLIPGVATVSELMQAMDYGYHHVKFFPAEAAGGVAMLKSMAGPFPYVRFCPTGGIGLHNYRDYLVLPNVACVGGSWLLPHEAIQAGNWEEITRIAASI